VLAILPDDGRTLLLLQACILGLDIPIIIGGFSTVKLQNATGASWGVVFLKSSSVLKSKKKPI
jgi:hypothetical protein